MINQRCIVLNQDMSILGTTNVKRAICLIVSGKAEVLAESNKRIHPLMKIPLVIRLMKAIRNLWKTQVPWSKHNVHIRDNFTCQYCGKKIKSSKITIDHIIPVSLGGKNRWSNTVSSCFECNNKKGGRLPSVAGMTLIKIPKQPTIMEFIMKKIKNEGLHETLKDLGIY